MHRLAHRESPVLRPISRACPAWGVYTQKRPSLTIRNYGHECALQAIRQVVVVYVRTKAVAHVSLPHLGCAVPGLFHT